MMTPQERLEKLRAIRVDRIERMNRLRRDRALVWWITLMGGLFGFAAIFTGHWSLLVLSYVLDGIDGWVARRLGVASEAGSKLDWSVDVGLCGALVIALHHWAWVVFALACQTWSAWTGRRLSGRFITTVAYCVWQYRLQGWS